MFLRWLSYWYNPLGFISLCTFSYVVLLKIQAKSWSTISGPLQLRPCEHYPGNTCLCWQRATQRIVCPTKGPRKSSKVVRGTSVAETNLFRDLFDRARSVSLQFLVIKQCCTPLTQSASWPTSYPNKIALCAASAQTLMIVPTPSLDDNSAASPHKVSVSRSHSGISTWLQTSDSWQWDSALIDQLRGVEH